MIKNQPIFVVHDIPGRIRLIVPALKDRKDPKLVELMFLSIEGVERVRMEPIIQSIVIEYRPDQLTREQLREHILSYFNTTQFYIFECSSSPSLSMPKHLLPSIFSGLVLFLALVINVVYPELEIN